MTIVIDASITIAALSPDEQTDDTERYLNTIAVNDAVVPAIWALEVMHVFRRKVTRGILSPEVAAEALAAAQLLNVRVSSTSAAAAFTDIGRLARLHGLSPYDAAYLDCALKLDHPLATLDRRMRAAAAVEGIPVIPD
ncbi:type II toxin-antitoxin system VapC family toxin [Phreatobacter oligotrophus]|jgi:predicted nucleic acid-binding protein|uniref:type II toxin-antitoxin system VapC family toxin n=1 Tax=Phreatobacter oligotrophus TaxID=1122261 RepID=UPI00235319F9|nr:type II toxin-antitoxin system VapC family toxin [Phreatobacter oligotrophus]MBX9991305.1 type II toxin-antitoxin system VapC family toxin [Phreatobacter oligotrophus]